MTFPSKFVVGWAAFGHAVLVCGGAAASPLFELVGDTVGSSGFSGQTSRAAASAAAAYFNPALLTAAESGVEVGFFVLKSSISIDLDPRPDGVDVPEALRGSSHAGTYVEDGAIVVSPTIVPDSLPTVWLEDGCAVCTPEFRARPRGAANGGEELLSYAAVGLVQPLFEDHLVLGVHAVIPMGEFTAAHAYFADEREQFFSNSLHPELYGDRLKATSLGFGLASPIHEDVSVGISSTITLKNDATASTFVSDSDNQAETLQLSTDVGVRARVAPHLGISWRVSDALSFSASAHSPQKFAIGTAFSAALPDGNEQFANRAATHDLVPWLVGGGAELTLSLGQTHRLALTGEVELARWSRYVDRQSERPRPGYEWADTVSPTFGARLLGDVMTVFVDATYVPTPVPAQTGRSNYVDNDRISGTLGGDYAFRIGRTPMRIGGTVQLHGLLARTQEKQVPSENPVAYDGDDRFGAEYYPSLVVDEVPDDGIEGTLRRDPLDPRDGLQTNNPGFPGFGSGGWLLGGGVNFTIGY